MRPLSPPSSTSRTASRSGGGRTRRVRATLIVVEVAASAALLVSAGLLLRAVYRLQSVDPGFRPENVLTLRTALPWTRYSLTDVRERFYRRVLDEVRALPGVQSAAYVTAVRCGSRVGSGRSRSAER